MESESEAQSGQRAMLVEVFRDQLVACLDECSRGRHGLFSDIERAGSEDEEGWPEAARLRELAMALQEIYAQQEAPLALCDEFLDLCTIHGENHPGEARLARSFLARIESNEVGSSTHEEPKYW